jgi:acetyl esterase
MPVDPDAQQVLDALAAAFPGGLGAMSVQEAREAMTAMQAGVPPGPPVHAIADRSLPGPAGDIPVRIYTPTDSADLPVLVWMHGGAFALGEPWHYDRTCSEIAVAAGALVVSVDYRLAPEHKFPAGAEDCYAATAWVAEHAAEIGGDAAVVAVGGDSAGGTLAAVVALMARDRSGPSLVHQLLVYPTTLLRVSSMEYADMPLVNAATCEHYWQLYVGSDADRKSPYCAPMNATDLSGLPPAFVVVPEVDPTRGDQERYAQRLAEAGVLTKWKRYPGSFHGFLPATFAIERAREAMADLTTDLRTVLARGRAAAAPR